MVILKYIIIEPFLRVGNYYITLPIININTIFTQNFPEFVYNIAEASETVL